MITFEEAYSLAKEHKPAITGCEEYENGFVFLMWVNRKQETAISGTYPLLF